MKTKIKDDMEIEEESKIIPWELIKTCDQLIATPPLLRVRNFNH